jgi:large subunit ribosomal protein L19
VAARGDVRRAKLYYLRGRVGKRARVREQRGTGAEETVEAGLLHAPSEAVDAEGVSAADAPESTGEAPPVEPPAEEEAPEAEGESAPESAPEAEGESAPEAEGESTPESEGESTPEAEGESTPEEEPAPQDEPAGDEQSG